MRKIGEHHAAEIAELRGRLDALRAQIDGGLGLPMTERTTMNLDEFRERIATLALGEMATLSQVRFEQAFSEEADLTRQRAAAIALAEKASCRLMFGQADPYTVFTRRQRLLEVRSSWGDREA